MNSPSLCLFNHLFLFFFFLLHQTGTVEVHRINALPGITWRAKVHDRFKGHPLGAAKALCGVQKDSHDIMLTAVRSGKATVFKVDPDVTLPSAFDSETNWPHCAKVIGDIRDQSACGCCWAFGAAEAASDRLWTEFTIPIVSVNTGIVQVLTNFTRPIRWKFTACLLFIWYFIFRTSVTFS